MSKIFAIISTIAFAISLILLVRVSYEKEVISQVRIYEAKELGDYKLLTLHFVKGMQKEDLLKAIKKDFPRAKVVEKDETIRVKNLCFNVKDGVITRLCKGM